MKIYKFAVLGTGFWSTYQLAGWAELEHVKPIAFYNRTLHKADALAKQFGVEHVYDNVEELFDNHAHELDFVDIITDVDTHALLTEKAASRGIQVICQKPIAKTLSLAAQMVDVCAVNGVQLYIHENFRFQAPIRKIKSLLDSHVIGQVFKATVSFCSGFPVFNNQPFLKELEEFILTDIGSHILDIARYLLGEVESVYCQVNRVNQEIKGEDAAYVLMRMKSGASCFVEMSYASVPEKEPFPQTLIKIEGADGTIHLTYDYNISVTTHDETSHLKAEPRFYSWADPEYAVVHASIVDCNRNIFEGIQGFKPAETTGVDNLKTIQLVHAAYESARENKVVLV